MKQKFNDTDVVHLLANLKAAENNYPADMIRSRRDAYLKQAAAMSVLVETGGDATMGGTSGGASAGSASMGKLLEIALVTMIVVEAGVAAYVYRDKIAEFFNSTLAPKVEVVPSPPESFPSEVPADEEAFTMTPAATPTFTVTVTETPAPVATISPAAGNNEAGITDSANSADAQIVSTPNPKDKNNSGLHLGQTKQPTKDTEKNDSSDSKDKENKK